MKSLLSPFLQALVAGILTLVLLYLVKSLSGWSAYLATGTLLFAVSAWIWKLRADLLVSRRLNPSSPDLLPKLTSQLPVLVYQFRTYPTGHSSVTFASDAIRTIYEVEPEEAKKDGSIILEYLHPDDFDRINKSLRHSYFTLAPWSGEFRVILPKAGLQWRFAQALVERLPDGGTLWHGFVADITEKKRAEESERYGERMRLARDRAEGSERAKNAFLTMMSHEIRTPMHAVMGYLDLLKSSGLSENQNGYVESAQSGARSMLSLLDDLLAVVRIEQGDLDVVAKDFDFADWIRGLSGIFRQQTEAKGLEWKLQLGEKLPESLCTDRVRLTQCLFGILENAVKFTKSGSVALSVTLQEGMVSRRVRMDITDTGPGLSAQDLEKIFEPFARVDESQSRAHGGLGLGLAICHNLAHLLGGTLTATSTVGSGSTFSLELPIGNPQVKPPAPSSPPKKSGQHPKLLLHVLIVEDQKTNQLLLGLMLKKIGCTYDFADNGLEGVRKFEEYEYDAILMDLQMPEMDGVTATIKIRSKETKKPSLPPVPIIAVTANAFETDRRECEAAGMNDFLPKPVRVEQLADSLQLACRDTKGRDT